MKLKYNFEIMELDEEHIAVPVGDNAGELHGIVKFNSTGAEIIKLIQEEKSEEEIVEELSKEYDSALNEIQEFVTGFIAQLKEAGLLE